MCLQQVALLAIITRIFVVHVTLLPNAANELLGHLTLQKPTAIAWDDENGLVLIAEKTGVVKVSQGWSGEADGFLLDIQNQVADYGDHGLTSIVLHNGFVWAAYMKENPQYGDICADYGQYDGRPNSEVCGHNTCHLRLFAVIQVSDRANLGVQMYGCRVTGRLSRWPYKNGFITGYEQVIIDGDSESMICGQFSSHGITDVIVGPDNAIYVAVGDGAGSTGPDFGAFYSVGANAYVVD
jgi:hypothetical protein